MKVVNGEDVLEASKYFNKGVTRQNFYDGQLKGKIILDRIELEAMWFMKVFINAHERGLLKTILGKQEKTPSSITDS